MTHTKTHNGNKDQLSKHWVLKKDWRQWEWPKQGPDSTLARTGESHNVFRETEYALRRPVSGIYYLKAEKPDAGYFRGCSVKTEKLSRITYGHPVMACSKSDTDSNSDFPSSTQVGMMAAHRAQARDRGSHPPDAVSTSSFPGQMIQLLWKLCPGMKTFPKTAPLAPHIQP